MKRIQVFERIRDRLYHSRVRYGVALTVSLSLGVMVTWHSSFSNPVAGKSPALTFDLRQQKLIEAIAALCFTVPSYWAVRHLIESSEQSEDLRAINRWSRAQWAEAAAAPPSQAEIDSFSFTPPQPLQFFNWTDLLNRPNKYAHILILGKTGSGKSFVAEHLLNYLHGHFGGESWAIHPHIKPGEFQNSQVKGRGRDFDAIGQALQALIDEMQRRYECRDKGDESYPWLHVVLDEFPAIAKHVSSASGIVADLGREARKVKIRLILLVQGDEVKSLGIEGEGSIRNQFTYIRLDGFVRPHANTLKNPLLSQWIADQEFPCMVEDMPANSGDLMGVEPQKKTLELTDTHLAIFDFALRRNDPISARELQEARRIFRRMSAEQVRAFFYELESQGFGTVDTSRSVARYTPFTRKLTPPSAGDSN